MKLNLLEMTQVTVVFILMNVFVGFTETKTGAKLTPREPKLSYFDLKF